jgi:hypothetical protein
MMSQRGRVVFITILISFFSCISKITVGMSVIDHIAESYVKLVLKVGIYDPNYVDHYYGPDEWKPSKIIYNPNNEFPYDQLKNEVKELLTSLNNINHTNLDKLDKLRINFLSKQLHSVDAKIELLSGVKMTFDEESKAFFDAVAPSYSESHYKKILTNFDNTLPGEGDISEKIKELRNSFIVPHDKIDVVFKTSVSECRKRTLNFIKLPEHDNFNIEFVTKKPWSAYNWFKGNSNSLIQLNIDIPLIINSILFLASHEGYPGHHVHHSLLEKCLFQEKGWIEFSIYPLFSPLSLIAEGLANYAVEMIFAGDERISFEKEILFQLAGLDSSKVDNNYRIMHSIAILDYKSYSSIEAARQYLDGKMSKEETINWLKKYSLVTHEKAEKEMIPFFEQYRSYIINYKLGQDLIQNYLENNGGTKENPQKRWELFFELLTTPQIPSELN